jgi:hypothetical protein
MCIEIICEECIREMAQSKEYSKNDFLYSGYDTELTGAYDCKKTDVQWDDLIQESCNTFAKDIEIKLIINGKDYIVKSEGPGTNKINTISEFAKRFTQLSPYNFSYNSSGNYLTIDAAKITFNSASTKSASSFLGYSENSVLNKLPYTLPNKIKITASADSASLYDFSALYNIKLNSDKLVDIRADVPNQKPYYSDKSLVSGLSEPITAPPYVNNLQLVRHLNKKMIGYGVNPSDVGNCFYKFNYDYGKDALIVSDLVLYSTSVATSTFTFKVGSTDANGNAIDESYTYTITRPIDSGIQSETSNDVIARDGKFRKFDIRNDAIWDPSGNFMSYRAGYNKITPPTIKSTTGGYGAITGVYTNGLFVCDINNTKISTFQIAFDTTGGNSIIFMCSGSKYVKIADTYYTLPYTQKISNGTNGSNSNICKKAKRNKSLCDNKKSAQTIMDKTQKHPGFDQQYIDAKGFSDMSALNIINLGIGIIAAAYFIAKTYKPMNI